MSLGEKTGGWIGWPLMEETPGCMGKRGWFAMGGVLHGRAWVGGSVGSGAGSHFQCSVMWTIRVCGGGCVAGAGGRVEGWDQA